jgi:Calcineurin-like phosphoesterase
VFRDRCLILGQVLNRDYLGATLAPIADTLSALQSEELERPADAATNLTRSDLAAAEQALRGLVGNLPSDPHSESGEAAFQRRGEISPIEDFAYIPQDALASIVQSALEQGYREREPESSERRAANVAPAEGELPPVTDEYVGGEPPEPAEPAGEQRRIFGKFQVPTDVGWVSCKIAEALRHFRHRKPFVDAPAHRTIGNRARLVVVGDWGTGIPRARRVGESMRDVLVAGIDEGLEQHAVHLGDVYYSGFHYEYRDRFLANWPVWPEEAELVGSWSLAGNHDLYSGGYGYFETLLADPRFRGHQNCSYFMLENDHWRIIGLDTGWEDGGLAGNQASWLEGVLPAEQKRTLLFSHHQGLSVYSDAPALLHKRIAPVLKKHPCDVWFWGHEHRCMAFHDSNYIGAGRCLGHGGVPEYQFHGQGDAPAPGSWEYRDVLQTTLGLEPWGVFGFAVIELEDKKATVRYMNEFGNDHNSPDSI